MTNLHKFFGFAKKEDLTSIKIIKLRQECSLKLKYINNYSFFIILYKLYRFRLKTRFK